MPRTDLHVTSCLNTPLEGSRILLNDGRLLGYSEYGSPDGFPVFYFHGFPGTRLEAGFGHKAGLRHAIRLIGVDRPGYGLSSNHQRRRLLDWPCDVLELADTLGIKGFSVIGISGGGPYAAACAYKIPEPLRCAVIVCGLGPAHKKHFLAGMDPLNKIGLLLAGRAPFLIRPLLVPIVYSLRFHTKRVLNHLSRRLGEPDASVLRDPLIRRLISVSFQEAVRGGGSGLAGDARLYARPWGIPLHKIRARVQLLHGLNDRFVPPTMTLHMRRMIPDAHIRLFPDEGHLSLPAKRFEDILSMLAG